MNGFDNYTQYELGCLKNETIAICRCKSANGFWFDGLALVSPFHIFFLRRNIQPVAESFEIVEFSINELPNDISFESIHLGELTKTALFVDIESYGEDQFAVLLEFDKKLQFFVYMNESSGVSYVSKSSEIEDLLTKRFFFKKEVVKDLALLR